MSLASSAANQVLVAEINDVRPFARLLRGIGMKHNAVMTISEAGFEVTVEEIRTMCAIAWIPTNLFSTFTFNEPPTNMKPCFELSIDKLLQVLNIFGNATSGTSRPLMQSRRRWAGEGDDGAEPNVPLGKGSTAMRMTWDGHGYPLQVDLHESARGPTTTAKFNLMEPEELMNQEFNSDDCVLYLIMKSNWFIDALADIPPSASRITISASPRHQPPPEDVPQATASSNARREHQAHVGKFTMKATGDFGTAELDYPNDKEVMDKFDCEEEVSFSYHSSHVALLSRALQQSIKICLQIESTGFMCIQVMMPVPEGLTMGQHSGILEFKMHALEEDDV